MRIAETVTFGGSAMPRHAELRKDAAALRARADASGGVSVLAVWRGKPLMVETGEGLKLVHLPEGHPLLQDAGVERVFLGEDEGRFRFAADVSAWLPSEGEPQGLGGFVDQSRQSHPDTAPEEVFVELRSAMTALSPRDAELAATAKALLGWHASHGFCARCGARTEIAESGWQRRCPSCGAHHFPRTDPVVIMLILHGNDVLLGRSHGWPEGMYSLPAGFVEPGETIEAAVRREVAEETAIEVGAVDYLASQPWPFPASLMIGCRGDALTREITVDPEELDDAIWVSREEVAEALAGRHSRLKPARPGAIARFILENWLADRLD